MRIALAASEAVPFVKTGGLADVIGALPRFLGARGHDVAVFLPLYGAVKRSGQPLERVGVPPGTPFGLLSGRTPGSSVPFFFVEHDDFFGSREKPYADGSGDYGDNDRRFAFFSRAVLHALKLLSFRPDVLHVHDWQAAAAALFLRSHHGRDPFFRDAASVFTIHNLAYQGRFGAASFAHMGLPGSYFRSETLEFHGDLSLMKAGLVFADRLTTVSPHYALEIQTPEFGEGLDGILRSRAADLTGILNGIDTDIWNPETDPHLAARYSADRPEGKAACKDDLAARSGFARKDLPILGLVSRLVAQKGIDLVLEALPSLLERGLVNAVVLGSGERRFEEGFRWLERRFPGSFSSSTDFNDPQAHRIEAGADLFLMPSRFEPCGLNQMISMRYGTLPVVRPVGGLRDSVVPIERETVDAGLANGFHVPEASAYSLLKTIEWALAVREDAPLWRRLVRSAMSQDWSWDASARRYLAVFEDAMARRRSALARGEGFHEPASEGSADRGRPLPSTYGRDRLVGMRQSPDYLFAYWEIDGVAGGALERHGVAPGDLRLRVENLATGDTHFLEIDARGGRHYLRVRPRCAYRLAIGFFRGPEFVPVVASGEVPRPRPAPRPPFRRRARARRRAAARPAPVPGGAFAPEIVDAAATARVPEGSAAAFRPPSSEEGRSRA